MVYHTECFILTTVELTCIMLPVTGVRLLLSVVPLYIKQIKFLWTKRVEHMNDLLTERPGHSFGREELLVLVSVLFLNSM